MIVLKFFVVLNKKKEKDKKIFFYLLIDASSKIHFNSFIKLMPLKAAISGTRDKLVIPG